MQTIKTAIVVVLLLGVCYGAYVALNAPEPTLPPELAALTDSDLGLDIDNGAAVEIPSLPSSINTNATLSAPATPAASGLTLPNVSLPASPGVDTKAGPPSGSQTADASKLAPPLTDLASGEPVNLNEKFSGGLKGSQPDLSGLDLPADQEGKSQPLPPSLGEATSPEKSPAILPAGFPSLADSSSQSNASPSAAPSSSSSSLGASGLDPSNNAQPGSIAMPPLPALPGAANGDGGLASSGSPAGRFMTTPGLPSGDSKPTGNSAKTALPYAEVRKQVLALGNDGKLREALALLSPYYNHIDILGEERRDMLDLLDVLAGEVIYSRRHLLEPRFVVAPGDTLESIANKFRVSPEALGRINHMGDSSIVLAGMELKVLNGPFRGEVDLKQSELTLFLGDLYAGRFPITLGNDPAPLKGTYRIEERRRDKPYIAANSSIKSPTDPQNPYGGYWMRVGANFSIHGSPETTTPEMNNAGCISLAPLDVREVYILLTQGSEITIK